MTFAKGDRVRLTRAGAKIWESLDEGALGVVTVPALDEHDYIGVLWDGNVFPEGDIPMLSEEIELIPAEP